MSEMNEIRQLVADVATRMQNVIDSMKGDYSREAVCAKVDLGYVIRDLRRADHFLARAQFIVEPNQWQQDLEAGAIG